jgi:hypothetical protein
VDSILNQTKTSLGIGITDTDYDNDIIPLINTALVDLTQIGVGASTGFTITGATETWAQFMGTDPRLNSVITYVYLSTKLSFDPPASAAAVESIRKTLDKTEWRLNVEVENQSREENQNGV